MFQISGQYSARQFVEFCFRSEFQFDITLGRGHARETISVAFHKGTWVLLIGDDRLEIIDSPEVLHTTHPAMGRALEAMIGSHLAETPADCSRGVPARAMCDFLEAYVEPWIDTEVCVIHPGRDGWIDESGKRV
jgi:hypothetical protein